MTEQEMRNRTKMIDEEIEKLKEEREEYENYLHEKYKQEDINKRKSYIGKCFFEKGLHDSKNDEIKAFKILSVLDSPKERYAECLVLVDDKRYKNEYGIKIEIIGLWTPNQPRLRWNPSDPKIIDFYKEISQEEFNVLYRTYKQNLDEKAY